MNTRIDSRTSAPPITGAANWLSPEAAPSEAQLVRRVVQRDREAYGELYNGYLLPLYSLAIGLLNDSRAAEEVLQEVFVAIGENPPSSGKAVSGHFKRAETLTREKSLQRLRDGQRKLHELEDLANRALVAGIRNPTHPGGGVLGQQVAQLCAALFELPSDQRRVLELAIFGGLTHAEIAHALGESVGTIKSRIDGGMLAYGLARRRERQVPTRSLPRKPAPPLKVQADFNPR